MSVQKLREDIKFNNWISWIAIFLSLFSSIFVPQMLTTIKERNDFIDKKLDIVEYYKTSVDDYAAEKERINLLSESLERQTIWNSFSFKQ